MGDAELKKLNIARGAVHHRVTNIKKFAEKNAHSQDKDVIEFKNRLDLLENCFKEYDGIQRDILGKIDHDTEKEILDSNIAKADQFEELYLEVKMMLQRQINALGGSTQTPGSNVGFIGVSNAHHSVKLPTISLPTFDGSYDKWMHFHDTYQSLIHKSKFISVIEKFHYLKSSLSDGALDLIQTIEVSNENYEVAWSILKDRYTNKRLLVKKHVQALFDLQTVQRESSVNLRKLLDSTNTNLRILGQLGEPVDKWDTLVVHLVSNKFDHSTRKEWESLSCMTKANVESSSSSVSGESSSESSSCNNSTTVKEMTAFLQNRCAILESLEAHQSSRVSCDSSSVGNKVNSKSSWSSGSKKSNSFQSSVSSVEKSSGSHRSSDASKCNFCSGEHSNYKCPLFLKLSVQDRFSKVRDLKLCFNCLRPGHGANDCSVSHRCKVCSKLHHSNLHFTERSTPVNQSFDSTSSVDNSTLTSTSCQSSTVPSQQVNHVNEPTNVSQVFLSTAVVIVQNQHGDQVMCRMLLDSGSQSNFITEELCQRLKLSRKNVHIPVCGITDSKSSPVKHLVNATLKSRHNGYQVNLNFLVLSKITGELPSLTVDTTSWEIPNNITLADNSFNVRGKIDLLVGAEVFHQILCIGRIVLSDDLPTLQKTVFGWVVSGKQKETTSSDANSFFSSCQDSSSQSNYTTYCNHSLVISNLEEDLSKFWEVEELSSESVYTKEEELCEELFKSTTRRDTDGRFIVTLPVRNNLVELGDSYGSALRRFQYLETKLGRESVLHQHYSDFIQEYSQLGHMQEVNQQSSNQLSYFMPHHAVVKPSSSSTKVRVVFDASMKSTSGLSLNNVLMVGPTVQSDLLTIVLGFRLHKIVMTADITKMYRQVKVEESQQSLQQILWRSNPTEPVKMFKLTTVTYGTASAPFLSTRCLNQIAIENRESNPVESKIILTDFYVDDLMTGASTVEEAMRIQVKLIELLKCYGFELRKWCSNNKVVVNNVAEDLRETSSTFRIDDSDTVKTLGLLYQPDSDTFRFSIQEVNTQKVTKRSVLSEIAKIFDPLGLVGPVIASAKIFMQVLWQLKLDWDESLPEAQHTQWINYRNQLINLNKLQIDRWVLPLEDVSTIEIHGFCDASQKAYGASVYVRVVNENGDCRVNLLCSKSRVAPLKILSIPRLELCGALLLAGLVKSVVSSLDITISKTYLWTDSTIVLAWLKGNASNWKTFVSNRVGEIQRLTSFGQWNHVVTEDNPADLISRGCSADYLIQSEIWWKGPEWLSRKLVKEVSSDVNIDEFSSDELERKNSIVSMVAAEDDTFEILNKYSSFTKLRRVIAYCLRWRNIVQSKTKSVAKELSVEELTNAEIVLVKLSQKMSFKSEVKDLLKNGQVNKNSKLISLAPFLDEKQVIRVGGRLHHSSLSEDQKHPIVLSGACNLSKLMFQHIHNSHLHAGPQALLNAVREKFWPIGGKNLARQTVFRCIRCFKTKPKSISHIMGSLPEARVQPTLRPFVNTGIDYCGPILISRGGRSQVKVKSYVALFVCFTTKAVHLELVSDLTSNAFIAALRRFIGRRGKCLNLYSDNATNFVGANRELQELRDLFISQQFQSDVTNSLSSQNISWHFIPPRSPHFGGLWESGVKAAKHHLKRIMGSTTLTFEELNTVLVQIEAVLNSRPLTSLSNDPNDLRVLTPGHFIIGDSMMSTPEPDLSSIQLNKLSRWQTIQRLYQDFWVRWSKEYLPELQERTKWKVNQSNIKVGTLVLIKEDNLPPLKWSVGRVSEVHTGADNVVRVVTLKTSSGTFKRAVQKVCPFPVM